MTRRMSPSLILAVLALALAVVSLGAFVMRDASDRAAAEARELLHRSYLLADELRQSSDDLTRMARTYAATGDPRYEALFREILDIRNGAAPRPLDYHNVYWDLVTATGERPRGSGEPAALRALMLEAGFTDEEFALLNQSEDESNFLVSLETRAMNAVAGRFDDGSGEYALRGEPDRELAVALLHGDEYHEEKGRIMRPLERLFVELDERIGAEADERRAYSQAFGVVLYAALPLTILLIGASALLMARRGRTGGEE